MYCNNCDYEGREGEYLCRNCGSPLQKRVVKRPKSELQGRVIESVKDHVRSPLFVVAVVLYTIAMVVQVITDADSDFTLEVCQWLNLDDSMGWLFSVVNALPNMLTIVGLWMLFGGALPRDKMGTSGLKVLLVSEIMGLVSVLLIPFGVFSGLSVAQVDIEFGAILWMIIAGMMVFAIILTVKKINVIRTVRYTVDTGMPNSELSVFVGVMTIIAGGGGLTSILTDFNPQELLSSAALLMFGIHFFIYKSTMADLEEEALSYELGDSARSFYTPRPTQTAAPARPAAPEEHIPAWKRIQLEEQAAQREKK